MSGSALTDALLRVQESSLGQHSPSRAAPVAAPFSSHTASLVLYSGADYPGAVPWASGSLAQSNLPRATLSYRLVTA